MRIAMGVEYDGTAYNGWQKQDMGIGIQTIIEDAISKIANCKINVVCAGRTDAGVHALNQVIHFDVLIDRSIYSWQTGVNSLLPPDVNVNWAEVVSNEFHARFSAIQRTYQYQINNRKVRSSLMRNRYWWVHQNLDELIMQKGAEILIGKHDFAAFQASSCQASTSEREIFALNINRNSDFITVTVTANAFLQKMVRNLVGSLVELGQKERDIHWLKEVLESRDRKTGGITAPAHGLTLVGVKYPNEFKIPES
jgi:tRNA pseudouridine38-40 synthase